MVVVVNPTACLTLPNWQRGWRCRSCRKSAVRTGTTPAISTSVLSGSAQHVGSLTEDDLPRSTHLSQDLRPRLAHQEAAGSRCRTGGPANGHCNFKSTGQAFAGPTQSGGHAHVMSAWEQSREREQSHVKSSQASSVKSMIASPPSCRQSTRPGPRPRNTFSTCRLWFCA